MKTCILCSFIIVSLTNDACSNETNRSNVINTYDPGEATSKSQNFIRLPNYKETSAGDQPHNTLKSYTNVRFKDQSPKQPIKFEDDMKEHNVIDVDKADPGILLVDVTFNDDKKLYRNDRIFNPGSIKGESNNSENKIKFEGSDDKQEDYDDQESDDDFEESQNDASQVVFDDDDKADNEDSAYLNESETEVETTDKRIKFENEDNGSNSNNGDLDAITVTERVIFKDDSIKNQESNQESNRNKKRKQTRKLRFETKQTELAPIASNPPYASLGYPSYPSPSQPSLGDKNGRYQSYPTPGYSYPNYPVLYAGMAFPTPYPYSSIGPGYGLYPGYPVPGGQRPPATSAAYPSPGHAQADPSSQSNTRYPGQEYAGSQSGAVPLSTPQGGQPVPEYPYYQGYPVPAYPGYPPAYQSDPNSPYPPQHQAPYRPTLYPGAPHQGYQSGVQRPSRRPKSLTHRAVSAVAEALTSIALYDDQQCVPRILCEVAGGSTASSPTLLKASSTLQPLLSLLQAYNTVSSSPLFIFGHAAVTGLTAKANPAACQRAYPDCPSDPEKLIHYLNNHNGGFFRFFGQPQAPAQQQNLEQFYNYLSGQNGLPQQTQQNYGYLRPHGYGFPPQNAYAYPYNYGQNYYNEKIGSRNVRKTEGEVEERIQNKPAVNAIEAEIDSGPNDNDQDNGSNWSFPDGGSTNTKANRRDKIRKRPDRRPKSERQTERPSRGSKTLKFPDDRSDDRREIEMIRDYREQKHIFFPGESNYQIKYYTNYQTSATTPVNLEEYYFDYKHNFYVKRPKALKSDDVVYVVRGNGDPNHPEIVRVGPGQNI